MPNLKYYNQETSQWETLVVGAKGETGPQGPIGPQGPTGLGSVVVNSPITNSGTTTAANLSVDYSAFQYGRNHILNSDFEIYQRGAGTASYSSGLIYHPDRWGIFRGGFAAGADGFRINTGLTGLRYGHRLRRTAGNTSTNGIYMTQPMETTNATLLAGKTMTLSAWIRRGANFSNTLRMEVQFGTGTDQTSWVGFSNFTAQGTNFTLSESWVRYATTVTVPNNTTSMGVSFSWNPTGTAGANDWFDITGVQLEEGSQTTTYKRQNSTFEAELAACYRYYYATPGQAIDPGYAEGLNDFGDYIHINFPVTMRVAPTLSVGFTSVDNAVNLGQSGISTLGFAQKARRSGGSWPYFYYRMSFTASAEL